MGKTQEREKEGKVEIISFAARWDGSLRLLIRHPPAGGKDLDLKGTAAQREKLRMEGTKERRLESGKRGGGGAIFYLLLAASRPKSKARFLEGGRKTAVWQSRGGYTNEG